MPFINFKDKSIYYEIKEPNKREALVFIHGSGEHSFVWKSQLDGLDLDMSIIALDLPSHGKSKRFKGEDLSLDLYINSVKKLMEELNIERLILCGHSLGGAIAQSYYFRYPKDVKGLILMSTGGRLRVSPLILDNLLNDFDQFLDNISVGSFYRKTSKNLINPYIEEISKHDPEITHRDFEICNNFDILDNVQQIDVPCLILVGKADKLTPVKYQRFYKNNIRDSKLIIIKEAGHSVMLEKALRVNNEIKAFIESTT